MTPRRWAAGLFLISAALLAYELLLMRLLTLAYWGHFAALVISIAMLGVAAAGLFLFFVRTRVKARPDKYFVISAGLFALSAPIGFLCSQRLPFTPFLLTWSAHEYVLLGARALLFFIPFLAGGIAIGTPFVATVLPVGRLYFWNMVGSGVPALPMLVAMQFMHPMRLLIWIATVAIAAALLCDRRWSVRLGWSIAGATVLTATWLTPFRYSEYKELSKTLLLPEAKVLEERYGWDGIVHIVDSPHTRYLPGLSLNFAGTLPPSKLVFTDAGAMTLVFAADDVGSGREFLGKTPEAFSFHLNPAANVLHFYGGGADLLRAQSFGARDIRVIDDSAARVAAINNLLATIRGWADSSHFSHGDARQILEQATEPVDIIAVSLLGSHGTSTAGAASLDPSFLLTMEGISRVFDRVSARGHAFFTTWLENPPRSGVRLASLCIETLRARKMENPSRHLLALRSWSTLAILMSREPFDAVAIAALKKFCDENAFDLVWFDGIEPDETNRVNVIPDDPYYEAFKALLSAQRREFVMGSPFAIDPPTDDRPFFNQYFRWAAIPQWISTMGMSWLPFVEWGYILHVATLLVVAVFGLLILIVPCMTTRARPRARIGVLFFALGVGYMFVEIWAIYKVTQLVAHPLLASALVLSVMLASSGAGAVVLGENRSVRPARAFILLCGALGISILTLPLIIHFFFAQSIWARAAVAIGWVAAPAFFMGFPFPYALGRLSKEIEVPWALALNGFGSVLGSLVATLVAVHFGFMALGMAALGFYVFVALLCRNNFLKGHARESFPL